MALADDVGGVNLFHCYLIDIEIADTTYYISDLFRDYTYDGNNYQPLGELMGVGQIIGDINPGENATSIVVSGIAGDRDFKTLALAPKSKGGNVVIRRGLSPTSSADIVANDKVHTVYKGFVRNINFAESFPQMGVQHDDTVIFECSNLFGLKKNTPKTRRCNPDDFNDYTRFGLGFNYDRVMDNVAAISGKKFAFGRTG
jgi:hypothetical protein